MEKELLYRKIRDFLDRRLSEEDARAFAARVGADRQLLEEVNKVKLEMEMEKAVFDKALAEQMHAWDEEDSPPPKPPSNIKWYRLFLMLAIAIPLALALFFWVIPAWFKAAPPVDPAPVNQQDTTRQPSETNKSQETSGKPREQASNKPVETHRPRLYAGLITRSLGAPVTAVGETRGGASAIPLAEGARSYKNGAYETAFRQWEKVAQENEDYRGYAQQCMAYAALQSAVQAQEEADRKKWLDTAVQLCKEVLKDSDNEQVIPSTQWNLLLVYLYRDGKVSLDFQKQLSVVEKLNGYEDQVKQFMQNL